MFCWMSLSIVFTKKPKGFFLRFEKFKEKIQQFGDHVHMHYIIGINFKVNEISTSIWQMDQFKFNKICSFIESTISRLYFE